VNEEASKAVFVLTLGAVPTIQTSWWDDFCNCLVDNQFLDSAMIPKKSITITGVVSQQPHRAALKPFAFNIHNGKNISLYHFAVNHMMSLDASSYTNTENK
jgi:hypothetical protein